MINKGYSIVERGIKMHENIEFWKVAISVSSYFGRLEKMFTNLEELVMSL